MKNRRHGDRRRDAAKLAAVEVEAGFRNTLSNDCDALRIRVRLARKATSGISIAQSVVKRIVLHCDMLEEPIPIVENWRKEDPEMSWIY